MKDAIWLVALAAAPVVAAFEVRAERSHNNKQIYVLKSLATFCILLIAALAPTPVPGAYQAAIVIGLLLSLAGDVFLMLPGDHFLAGLASFLVAHVCYIAAFVSSSGVPNSVTLFLFLVAYGFVLLRRLWPRLASYRMPVAIYAVVLLGMVASAHGQLARYDDPRAWLAFIGAVLFMISDSVLALDRFETGDKRRQTLVLSTYFGAQWLIAASVTQLVR